MRLHVLGYWGAYPEPGEATTGFLLETDEAKILIDCGSGVLSQLFKVASIADLDAAVITHHHHDHVADLGVLGYAVLISRVTGARQHPLPVYMPAGNPGLEAEFSREPLISLHLIDETSRITVAGATFTFGRTEHPVFCLGMRIESQGKTFAFSADSSDCDALPKLAEGANLFLCEASMYANQQDVARQAGHLTSEQAGRIARSAGVQRLAITHYPHYGDLHQLEAEASTAFGQPVEMLSTLKVIDF